jgi:hypothetical protein
MKLPIVQLSPFSRYCFDKWAVILKNVTRSTVLCEIDSNFVDLVCLKALDIIR